MKPSVSSVWIVHRDPVERRTLAVLAGRDVEIVAGGPADPIFDTKPAPEAVVLGPAGDFELELEFARRFRARLGRARWLLVLDPADAADARKLFDTLPAEVVPVPSNPEELRPVLGAALRRRHAPPLSERDRREAVARRFARWFADLDPGALLRGLDPHLMAVPVLIRGGPGSGRRLMAHYVHGFGGDAPGPLVCVSCAGVRGTGDLMERLARSGVAREPRRTLGVCLEEIDRLPRETQRDVRDWLEIGPPPGLFRAARVRWMATAPKRREAGDDLDPDLARALTGLEIRIPPLRERSAALGALAASVAAEFAAARGEAPRSLGEDALEALRAYPFPGNVRELEAVVRAALVRSTRDPLTASDLDLGPELGAADASRDARTADPVPPAPHSGAAPAYEPAEPPPRALAPRTLAPEGGPAGSAAEKAGPERELAASAPGPAPGSAADPAASQPAGEDALLRLAGAVAHEVRNPLVGLSTLGQLGPEQLDETELRRLAGLAGSSAQRIERVMERLARFAELGPARRLGVDVVALLDRILEEQRGRIQERRLVVLKELDAKHPQALGDADRLHFALQSLVGQAIELVPPRGDLYVASGHDAEGLPEGGPALRVMMRFRSPQGIAATGEVPGVSLAENALDFALAEAIVRAHGGRMTVSAQDGRETLILIDLPAPR